MINVNASQIKKIADEFDITFKDEEKNSSKTIHEIESLKNNWNDEHIIPYFDSFQTEKGRIIRLNDGICKQKSLYRYVYNRYIRLGNNIKCNLDGIDYVNYWLDVIIDQLEFVISQYRDLGDISWFPKSYLIYNEWDKLYYIRESFINIKNSINYNFNYVRETENGIHNLNSKIKIEKFKRNYDEYRNRKSSKNMKGNYVGMSASVDKITDVIDGYIRTERVIKDKIVGYNKRFSSCYNSGNSGTIGNNSRYIDESLTAKIYNLDDYNKFVKDLNNSYKQASKHAENILSNAGRAIGKNVSNIDKL